LLLGVILLAVLLYRPQGIFVEKPTRTITPDENELTKRRNDSKKDE